jgi:hypothetical protein
VTSSASHRGIVESLGEAVASVEIDGAEVARIPRALLPIDVQVGDALTITVVRDEAGTREALRASAEQMAEAPLDDATGDVTL